MIGIPHQYLIYDGANSLDFNVKISGDGTFSAPEREVEKIEVPGRSGDLILDNNKFKNITVKYDAYITKDFSTSAARLRAFLLSRKGYLRLEDTYHPSEFRMAAFKGPFDPSVTALESADFTLSFDCMPQRWLKSGENYFTVLAGETVTVRNPTEYTALPLILVTGTGTFQVNDITVQVNENSGATVIDSDIQNCYEGTINRNPDVAMTDHTFPSLEPGQNTIIAGAGIVLQIKPRWWTI